MKWTFIYDAGKHSEGPLQYHTEYGESMTNLVYTRRAFMHQDHIFSLTLL